MTTQKKGLTVKDLVTTGIFTALVFIFSQIGGIPFGMNPATTFYLPIGAAILSGPVYLLLIAKVPKRGPLTIVGIMLGIIEFILGMHWAMDLGLVLCGVVADFVAGSQHYRSSKANIAAFAIQNLGYTGAYIVIFLNPQAWVENMVSSGNATQSYADTMLSVATPTTMVIMFVGTIVMSALSGWAGKKLMKKQFEKAGIL